MEIVLFLQTYEDKFISEMVNALQEDINSLAYINEVELPEIATGFFVMLRVYTKEDLKYPARAEQIATFSKKEACIRISVNIEIETLIGKSGVDIYNLFLDRIMDTFFILEKKKIKGADIEKLKAAVESLKV